MFALTFLILPQIASQIDADSYGQIIAIVAFMNLSASTFGSVLNNLRLIRFKEYRDLNIKGDFSIILVISIIANVILMIAGLLYYGKNLQTLTLAIVLFSSIFLLIKTYAGVEFRIKLNFKNILLESIFLFLGYLIGFILFILTGHWVFIYLCGFGFSLLFILKKTNILREPLKKTLVFKATATQAIILLISGFLVSLGAYIDKLIIFPMLGGAAVSIYYTATILGKTIALVMGPITGVLLSYLAQMKKFSNHNFKLLLFISTIVGIIGYWGVIIISEPLLTIIYPQYVTEALKYIQITTLSIILTIVSNVINSVLLKFCNAKWQLLINIIYMAVYISASMGLLILYGLLGFCIGILIASFIKLILTIVVYYINDRYIK